MEKDAYLMKTTSTEPETMGAKELNNSLNQTYNLVSDLNTSQNGSKPIAKPRKKTQSFESSLILMHKFFKEQKIYSDPNDNFKRRTVVLVRTAKKPAATKSKSNLSDSSVSGEFGFNLQTYGLLNSITKDTEYICFVNNVQAGSSAKRAGLNNGDVLLAIDGIQIDQFKSFTDITKHVKGKNELRLVIMAENVCKKIQCQQRIDQIEKILAEKKLDLERVRKQEEFILKKYGIAQISMPSPPFRPASRFSTPNVNSMSSSTTSSNSTNNATTPTNEMSPMFSTSGVVSECSAITSTSVSNSSSFSSSATNSSLTNTKNVILVKNSTPNDANSSLKHSNYLASPIESSFVRSSSGTSFIKVIRPSDQNGKQKSLTKKYIEQTSRIVRSASSSSVNLVNSLLVNNAHDESRVSAKSHKITLKDATTTSSSTDDAMLMQCSESAPNKRLSVDSQHESFISRIVRLGSNSEANNFSKKKNLFNKLNSSAHTIDYSYRTNGTGNRESQSRNNSLTLSSKNALFKILANKPKIAKAANYASVNSPVANEPMVQARSKSLSSPYSNFKANNDSAVARIRSTGGFDSSFLDSSEFFDLESSNECASVPIPLIDYNNEDYVVTRL
ncbi:general receptor for phosphoinositides 1-associated scaffold -like isoform X1 [Brachionus plicatilis]|uniref:General receptor for phosphoinositides 1-associated scaffold-like isoform X1 n=1 Tax=Brachionus plicatilis TaxID=10195 RepID=A0A3M7QU54_BRAPC|nr:general receptor for phosphoinositides 1-associated scaffold -like isoform X1 [Brachionus plicatilis]